MTNAQLLDHKYRLGKVLQQGERAVIVAATHLELREPVVIKVLDAEQRDPRFAARLRREARHSSVIRSEHVVRYLDVGHLTDGRPYVVMERLTGETLAERLASRGPLPATEAIDAVLQICEALAAAHVRGIVHRDLRTSNLFCTQQPDGRMALKVLNFGTARAIDAAGTQEDQGLTVAVLALNAPDYKAPEQIVARRDLDGRVDIWALGVVMYELLTGRRPFAGASPEETVRRILGAQIAPAPELPADLVSVIQGCLRGRPEERWASVAELADALAERAGPNTMAYPKRVRGILETPPAAEPEDEDEDEEVSFAPTMVRDMLALSRQPTTTEVRGAIQPTASGLPRIDNGRTNARSYPWLNVEELKSRASTTNAGEGSRRWMLFSVFVTTLFAMVIALMLLVPRLAVDLHVGGREPNATASAHPPSPPPVAPSVPPPQAAAAAEPSATPAAEESAQTAPPSDPAAGPKSGPRPSSRIGAGATGTSPPRTGTGSATTPGANRGSEGDDPWGWER